MSLACRGVLTDLLQQLRLACHSVSSGRMWRSEKKNQKYTRRRLLSMLNRTRVRFPRGPSIIKEFFVNQKNTEKFFNDFPNLYRSDAMSMRESLMSFGFECGDGWFRLIHDLSAKLDKLILETPECDRHHVHAFQVKEKYGELSFYMSLGTGEMYDLIEEAERASTEICEQCGQPGKLRNKHGWMYTACEECKR